VQNGELEKTGFSDPIFYRSRLFLRQTWNLGGESTRVESGPMQLAKALDSRRFVLTAGNLAIIDIFDRNAFAGDIRQQFLSMNFATYAAYDFAADARGYSWGLAGEYYHDDWVLRAGRFLVPRLPNQLQLDHQFMKYYGDQVELERGHRWYARPGKVQVLAYRNVALMGRWNDAIDALRADPSKTAANCSETNYGSDNAAAPDLCYVRGRHVKVGIGASLEQSITDDIGVNLRAMKSDGRSEVDAFESADSSLALAALFKGTRWKRAQDSAGIGFAQNWISSAHANFLSMGGVDAFIGDGAIRNRPERAFEAFVKAYRAKYGKVPSYYSENNYTTALWIDETIKKAGGKWPGAEAFIKTMQSIKVDAPRGPVELDDMRNPIENVYIKKVEKKKMFGYDKEELWNTVIKTYPNVSQFWTYDKAAFLKQPVYSRDFPPCKYCN